MKYLFILLAFSVGCQKTDSKPQTKRVPVKVAKVIEKTVPYFLDTVGNVFANNTVSVNPQVGGMITEIHVKEGQMVKKGDLLYVIDPRPFEAQVLQAEGVLEKDQASLAYQRVLLERNSKLIQGDYISAIQIEQFQSQVKGAEGQVKQDEASLELAKINLDYCYVTSPINGKISQYNINLGNVVTANNQEALTVIREIQPVQVQFSYPQREFEEILRDGGDQPFKYECTLYNNKERVFSGDVYFYDNSINTNSGAILFKGLYPNEDLGLWPGAFIKVRMFVKTLENATLLPLTALEKGQQGFTVFVVKEDHTVEPRSIQIGHQVDEFYVVKDGVKPGETVVTLGQLNLRPGTVVEIKP